MATAIVVPAYNEEEKIGLVIANLLKTSTDHIIVIVNGSHDNTLKIANEAAEMFPKVKVFNFEEKLGIDVPRAIGAKIALSYGVNAIGFVDGDMTGMFMREMDELLAEVAEERLDLALTNCYEHRNFLYASGKEEVFNEILEWRVRLSRAFRISSKVGVASPLHGPHVISAKLINSMPLDYLAIPPAVLAFAAKNKFKIGIAANIAHYRLESSNRGNDHNRDVRHTIVGDCIYALKLYKGETTDRTYEDREFIGYHNERKFNYIKQEIA